MGKQSLFQSLYNKYNRKNIYFDFYSKVIITWIFLSSFDCLLVFSLIKFADLTWLIFSSCNYFFLVAFSGHQHHLKKDVLNQQILTVFTILVLIYQVLFNVSCWEENLVIT